MTHNRVLFAAVAIHVTLTAARVLAGAGTTGSTSESPTAAPATTVPNTSLPARIPTATTGTGEEDRPLTLQQQRDAFLTTVEPQYRALKKGSQTGIEQIISVKAVDGLIELKSLIPPTEGEVAFDLKSWPGMLTVMSGRPDPQAITFKHIDTTSFDAVASYTHVSAHQDYLQINRDTEWPTKLISVTLMQAGQFADSEGRPVRLLVRGTDDDQPTKNVNITLAANTYQQLLTDHPVEVRQYLLPVLRSLHATGEGLTSISGPQLAWQVFGGEIDPDPLLIKKIDQILAQLDADDFKTRSSAQTDLANLGPAAAAVLVARDRSSLTPDQRGPVEAFIRSSRPLKETQATALKDDVWFNVDSLLIEEPRLQKAAAERVEALTGVRVNIKLLSSADERDEVVSKLSQQVIRSAKTTSPATQPSEGPVEPNRPLLTPRLTS